MGDITLYTIQLDYVIDQLQEADAVFCKREYISLKYGESAPILLAVYDWFAREAAKLTPKPPEAETPYWAYTDKDAIELFPNESVLTLKVPREEAVYFSIEDWSTVLRLQLLTEDAAKRAAFAAELKAYGIRQESDIFLRNFYPAQKQIVQDSWQRLFRHHAAIRDGQEQPRHMQAALWQIKREWIEERVSTKNLI